MPAYDAVSGNPKAGVNPPNSDDVSHLYETSKDEDLDQAFAAAAAAVDERSEPPPSEDGTSPHPTKEETSVSEALSDVKRELEETLEKTKKEAEQFRERWMRAAADLENHRRRAAREREDVQKFGIERLLKDLLPVMDDIDRAIQVVGERIDTESNPQDPTSQLLSGVRLVHKKFISTLEKHGVTTFESKGTTFNPERHEAVQQSHSELPSGAVAAELQKGFLIHDRLLRPALVVVSLGPEGGEASSEDSE